MLHTINYDKAQEKILNGLKKCINGAAVAILSMRPEISMEEKIYTLESIQTHNHTKYIKQMVVESLQRAYEHLHFLGGPLPKSIELYRQKGTISHTPIPFGSKGWIGRSLLIPGNTVTGYYVYAKGFTVIQDGKNAISNILSGHISEIDTYLIFIAFFIAIGSPIYYTLIKGGDIEQAEKQVYQNIILTNEK